MSRCSPWGALWREARSSHDAIKMAIVNAWDGKAGQQLNRIEESALARAYDTSGGSLVGTMERFASALLALKAAEKWPRKRGGR